MRSNKDRLTFKSLLFSCLLLSALAAALFLLPAPVRTALAAPAASITVDSLADTTGGGVCTLRDAIKTINDNIGYGTCGTGASLIRFSVTGSITLTSDLPHLQSMTTDPVTSVNITIVGQNLYRAFILILALP